MNCCRALMSSIINMDEWTDLFVVKRSSLATEHTLKKLITGEIIMALAGNIHVC